MTATTPALNLPYAEDTDARGAGAQAIKKLATATEEAVLGSYALRPQTSFGTLAANTSAELPLGDALAKSGHWTRTGNGWVYEGPTRAHLIAASVTTGASDGLVSGDYLSSMSLKVNGTEVVATDQRIQTGASMTATWSHSLTAVVILTSGSVLTVTGQTSRPSSVSGALHVHSIGPRAAS